MKFKSILKLLSVPLFTFVGLLIFVSPSYAISLDSTYGTNGVVGTTIQNSENLQKVLGIQSTGKAIIAGVVSGGSYNDWAIARYNTDGTLDRSFGSNGIATRDFGTGVAVNGGVVVQSDDKIIVVGTNNSVPEVIVGRFNADGSPDTTFGVNGIATTTFGSSFVFDRFSIALQSDGKMVIWGSKGTDQTDSVFVMARFNMDGSLDTSFGTNGTVTVTAPSAEFHQAQHLAIQPTDGKIVTFGSLGGVGGDVFMVYRFNTDGSLDTSFGTSGYVQDHIGTNDLPEDIAIQSDSKILISGNVDGVFTVIRYNSDGSRDTTFASNGLYSNSFGSGSTSANSIIIQSNSQILLGGYSNDGSKNDLFLARLNADGTLDTSFGNSGSFVSDIGSESSLSQIISESNGNILGSVTSGSLWSLAQYTSATTPSVEISASPTSGTYSVGQPFTVNIEVVDSGEAFNAASATVQVSNLTINGVNNVAQNSCNFNYTVQPTVQSPTFAGAIFGGSSTGCTVYSMTVTPNGTGAASVTVSNPSIKASSDNHEISTGSQTASYTIVSATPTPTPPGTNLVTVDDSVQGTGSNQWNYVGSGWLHCTDATSCNSTSLYNNSASWDNTTDDYVTLTFTGRQLILYGLVDPAHGIAGVSIDGGSETNVDFYSSTRKGDVELWTSPLLTSSQHTVKIRVTGNKNVNSTGTYIAIDRADIVQNVNSQLSVTNTVFVTYGPNFTITGTRDPSITKVYVNNTTANTTYPTSDTWQAFVPVSLGNNNITIYGTDASNNQTASIQIIVNMHMKGDIDGNGVVNLTDASLFAVDYSKTDPSTFTYALSDMNNDGQVNLTDLSILAGLEQQ